MPRQARLDIPGALHHIMVRGINKSAIFQDDQDKLQFLERLGKNITTGHCQIYAWVLMRNHLHILFRSGQDGISTIMRKLLTWYAQYFNRRHHRTGHLFENRYKSILCEEEKYLLALVRYIHLNPVRAKSISSIEEMDRYQWSGHRAIIGKTEYPWMEVSDVLAQFGGTKKKAVKEYRQFMKDGMGRERTAEFSGGGIIRSQGGWSHVVAMRRKEQPEEGDERILGSGEFVRAILKNTEERYLRQLKLRRNGRKIDDIIQDECKQSRVSPEELKLGNKRSLVSMIRESIAIRGREELGLSGAEMARHLGVNTSSINRALVRCEQEREKGA